MPAGYIETLMSIPTPQSRMMPQTDSVAANKAFVQGSLPTIKAFGDFQDKDRQLSLMEQQFELNKQVEARRTQYQELLNQSLSNSLTQQGVEMTNQSRVPEAMTALGDRLKSNIDLSSQDAPVQFAQQQTDFFTENAGNQAVLKAALPVFGQWKSNIDAVRASRQGQKAATVQVAIDKGLLPENALQSGIPLDALAAEANRSNFLNEVQAQGIDPGIFTPAMFSADGSLNGQGQRLVNQFKMKQGLSQMEAESVAKAAGARSVAKINDKDEGLNPTHMSARFRAAQGISNNLSKIKAAGSLTEKQEILLDRANAIMAQEGSISEVTPEEVRRSQIDKRIEELTKKKDSATFKSSYTKEIDDLKKEKAQLSGRQESVLTEEVVTEEEPLPSSPIGTPRTEDSLPLPEGAKQAADGNWYVKGANGKWLKVNIQ